jgi:hypothetical protein
VRNSLVYVTSNQALDKFDVGILVLLVRRIHTSTTTPAAEGVLLVVMMLSWGHTDGALLFFSGPALSSRIMTAPFVLEPVLSMMLWSRIAGGRALCNPAFFLGHHLGKSLHNIVNFGVRQKAAWDCIRFHSSFTAEAHHNRIGSSRRSFLVATRRCRENGIRLAGHDTWRDTMTISTNIMMRMSSLMVIIMTMMIAPGSQISTAIPCWADAPLTMMMMMMTIW